MSDYELLTNVAYYIKKNPKSQLLVTFKFREQMDEWIRQFVEYAKTVPLQVKSTPFHGWRQTITCGEARVLLSVFPFDNHEWIYGWDFNATFGYHQTIEYQIFNIRARTFPLDKENNRDDEKV